MMNVFLLFHIFGIGFLVPCIMMYYDISDDDFNIVLIL
jgi:hypothetical protein